MNKVERIPKWKGLFNGGMWLDADKKADIIREKLNEVIDSLNQENKK